MRLGLTSFNPLVWLLQAAGVMPSPLIVAFWGMESSRALITATELGLFDTLASEPLTAEQVAQRAGCSAVGVEALLTALAGFGYLKHRDGTFALRRSARRWLTSDARYSMVRAFGLYSVLWNELGDLDERVRDGDARAFHGAHRDAGFWQRYEMGLAEAAKLTAPGVARSVHLARPPARLLDVGGGHATFSAAFCERYPQLRATVLDFEPAARVGEALTTQRGLASRIGFRCGDLTTDEWGDGYDVVLLFNVLHVLDERAACAAVARAYAALAPGGTLAVLDAVHRGRRGGISAVAGGSELLFYAINGTRAYPESTITQWVRDAGFSAIRRKQMLAMPEVLITARR